MPKIKISSLELLIFFYQNNQKRKEENMAFNLKNISQKNILVIFALSLIIILILLTFRKPSNKSIGVNKHKSQIKSKKVTKKKSFPGAFNVFLSN
jgi:predicted negative regulator of RcsB-dependent stress response